jgi:uncharacterized protein (DUF2141 family)
MKHVFSLLIVLLTGSAFGTDTGATLTITLTNITKAGKINIAVYKEGGEFPDDKYIVKTQSGECKSSTCSFVLSELAYGEYAVAVYQDVNGNGKLDTGTFGIPSEPFAFSNNFKPKWGGPSFDKCKFSFSKETNALEIAMINSLFGSN